MLIKSGIVTKVHRAKKVKAFPNARADLRKEALGERNQWQKESV